jgi:hypothetical protein
MVSCRRYVAQCKARSTKVHVRQALFESSSLWCYRRHFANTRYYHTENSRDLTHDCRGVDEIENKKSVGLEWSFISFHYLFINEKQVARSFSAPRGESDRNSNSSSSDNMNNFLFQWIPGHLDEELSNLSLLARQFSPSQGITTAKAFLATGTKKPRRRW